MKKNTRYVFGAAVAAMAMGGGIESLVKQADAVLLTAAAFTFETSQPSTAGPFAAEVGSGTALGVHAGSSTYSSPVGNGSSHSFSSTDWAVGDYYQFAVNDSTISGIQLSFDQASSNTGPDLFSLVYSTDGTSFSTFGTYSLPYVSGSTAFSSTTSQTVFNHTFDLSSITGLNGNASDVFRLVLNSTTAAFNPTTTGFATSGTDRVDNFVVSGSPVPEPATLSILTLASAALLMRRRAAEQSK